jgi:hypothetical protein
MRRIHFAAGALALAAIAIYSGCGTDRSGHPVFAPTAPRMSAASSTHEPPAFPGADAFVTERSNPYLAFASGRVFRYESHLPEGLESDVVEVTRKTKTIMNVVTIVVHDVVSLDGEATEDTYDWYAQDRDGNVWYFGEDSKELLNGVIVGTEGSWEAGVNGAEPGIVMLAAPSAGIRYQQEFAEGVAQDMAKVVRLDATVQLAYGSFPGVLQTLEWSKLDSGVKENKYYASGVGLLLETGPRGERSELVSIKN